MFKVGGCGLSFEDFCSEVIEAAVADFKLKKIVEDSRFGGPLIATPKKQKKKLDAEAVETILAMKDEGIKTGEIAARFHVHPMTVQRIFRDNY
jgi:DNA invertase Pin-like site-specific DNA recombinase